MYRFYVVVGTQKTKRSKINQQYYELSAKDFKDACEKIKVNIPNVVFVGNKLSVKQ